MPVTGCLFPANSHQCPKIRCLNSRYFKSIQPL